MKAKQKKEMMDRFWSAARDVLSARLGQELPYSGFHSTQAVSGLQSTVYSLIERVYLALLDGDTLDHSASHALLLAGSIRKGNELFMPSQPRRLHRGEQIP